MSAPDAAEQSAPAVPALPPAELIVRASFVNVAELTMPGQPVVPVLIVRGALVEAQVSLQPATVDHLIRALQAIRTKQRTEAKIIVATKNGHHG